MLMRRVMVAGVVVSALGCSGPADVEGTYTANLTNGTNSCPGFTWTVGDQSSITLTATQGGDDVTLNVDGAGGVVVELILGAHAFAGKVSGNEVQAVLVGTRNQTRNECQYTLRGNLSGRLEGDTLTGTITYTPLPSNASAAACQTEMVTSCMAQQTFTATRAAR